MKFFSFFARRSGKGDAEAWQVGDWAERVTMGHWVTLPLGTPANGPRHGQVMRVTAVKIVRDGLMPGGQVLTLAFAGWPGEFFTASAFRKLNPRADEATAAEAEFTALIRRERQPALPHETIREHQ